MEAKWGPSYFCMQAGCPCQYGTACSGAPHAWEWVATGAHQGVDDLVHGGGEVGLLVGHADTAELDGSKDRPSGA